MPACLLKPHKMSVHALFFLETNMKPLATKPKKFVSFALLYCNFKLCHKKLLKQQLFTTSRSYKKCVTS